VYNADCEKKSLSILRTKQTGLCSFRTFLSFLPTNSVRYFVHGSVRIFSNMISSFELNRTPRENRPVRKRHNFIFTRNEVVISDLTVFTFRGVEMFDTKQQYYDLNKIKFRTLPGLKYPIKNMREFTVFLFDDFSRFSDSVESLSRPSRKKKLKPSHSSTQPWSCLGRRESCVRYRGSAKSCSVININIT